MSPKSTEILETLVPARRIAGCLEVPGDKSISHRYAILAALADTPSRFTRFSNGEDAKATLACLRGLGVEVRETADGASCTVEVDGRSWSGLRAPVGPLDAANSGTTLRLLAGVLATRPFRSVLTGDASLRRRPMGRILDPLERMGARVEAADGDRPPITILGGPLTGIEYRTPVPSAQVKSAILLAGLQAAGHTTVTEAAPTRDHTERALAAFGARVQYGPGWASVEPCSSLRGCAMSVPGDPSAAAFWCAAAAALPGSAVEILNVGLNPSRLAFLGVLVRAGARVETDLEGLEGGEPVGRIRVAHGARLAVAIAPDEVPGLIDELPVLAALATHGGSFTVSGASELRVKESDRIAGLVTGLRALGGDVEERADGFLVRGRRRLTGGHVDALGDHRLAMAFAVAALGAEGESTVAGAGAVAISYPGFFETLRGLCA
jgi:3-phosphoshikimate 1-carboxyvinyltransferase